MIEVLGQRVLIVGLARSGQAAALCLRRRGAVVTVTDSKPPSAFAELVPDLAGRKIGLELGVHRDETFLKQDLIVTSPGVPWDLPQLRAAREKGVLVLPEIEVARWYLPNRLIGITGSNGKTTTTTLLGKMLQASGYAAQVAGNIGLPLISFVDHVTPSTLLVVELSSFQLEASRHFRPNIAVLLNITPNHLDRHGSFTAYVAAKARVLGNLGSDDCAILNADDANVMSLVPAIARARKLFFSRRRSLLEGVFLSGSQVIYRVGHLERVLLDVQDVRLRGAFNLENVLAACSVSCWVGADFAAQRRAVREFSGVEHRLEFARQVAGVDFYNDSKATSVDATAKALSAFDRGVHLILGGKDKGAPYAPLRALLAGRVRAVYLIGAAADRIAKELDGASELVRAGDLETAVRSAFKRAEPEDVVLLAPACASFDQFQDFEHRGRAFKEVVATLTPEAPVPAVRAETSEGRQRDVGAQGLAPLQSVLPYEVNRETFEPGPSGAEHVEAIHELPLQRPVAPEDEPILFEVRPVPATKPD